MSFKPLGYTEQEIGKTIKSYALYQIQKKILLEVRIGLAGAQLGTIRVSRGKQKRRPQWEGATQKI
jgi:hypothetical protein